MDRFRRTTTGLLGLGALAWVAVGTGCGGSPDGELTLGAGGGSTASGGGSGTGAEGGGLSLTCSPPCEPPQFCGVTGVCLDPGTCVEETDCEGGLTCVQGECVPGGNCGQHEVSVEPVAPNLLIVLDRSCSMRRDLNNNLNPPGPNKWTHAVDAINQMTATFADQIRFGLILFPDTTGGNCLQDAPAVGVGPGKEPAIQTLLTNALNLADPNFPDGPCVTNIDTGMEQASQQPELQDPTRESYALLITDGKQYGCNAAGGDGGTEQILANMHAADVPTFVVGFGGAVDPAQLNSFAVAGGVPRNGSPQYYQADSAQELQQALDIIANETLGCVVQLATLPEDPDAIFVFFNNDTTPIPRDPSHTHGWDYDPATNQVTFYGPECDKLKSGQVTDVDVIFGCAQPTPD